MSVFARAGVKPVDASQVGFAQPQQAVVAGSFPSSPKPSAFPAKPATSSLNRNLLVTDADIDKIGEDVSRKLGATTTKIIEKMGVSRFDELGAILTTISAEADKLDPSSLQKGGVVGWFQNKFTDLKAQLTLRLKTAQQVFKGLEEKIAGHITSQQEWVMNLESLYNENFDHYKRIIAEMAQVESMIAASVSQLQSWPEIDVNSPDAAMEVQLKRDAESRINRMRLKLDNLMRLKAMTEINSPKIRQQQETSRATISTLKDVITQTLPIIQMEFVMFLQTLDVQKSVKLTTEVRTLATKTLTTGAEGAKVAAIESAKGMSTPVITNDTLNTLRSKMLETVVEVKRIETEAMARCQADAQHVEEGQRNLLTALKQTGTI